MNKNTDAVVLALVDRVKAKKKEINNLTGKPNWLTSCSLQLVEGNIASVINIQTVTDPKRLVEIYSFVLAKEEFVGQAMKELDYDIPKLTFQGYSFPDWKKDIKRRLDIILLQAKKDELSALEARLDKLITPEQRRELELADIQAQLND